MCRFRTWPTERRCNPASGRNAVAIASTNPKHPNASRRVDLHQIAVILVLGGFFKRPAEGIPRRFLGDSSEYAVGPNVAPEAHCSASAQGQTDHPIPGQSVHGLQQQ